MLTGQFEILVKDMSKAVSRVMSRPQLLEEMDAEQLRAFGNKLQEYNPKSDIGRESKARVIEMMAPAEEQHNEALDKETMLDQKTAVLFIKIIQPGFTKVIDTKKFVEGSGGDRIEDDAEDAPFDLKSHKVMQQLYGREFLKPLFKQRQEFFAWLERYAVPSPLLSSDNYLVPQQLINHVIERVTALETERARLVDELEAQWPQVVADAQKRLGPHFDMSQYEDFENNVRARFRPKYSDTFVKSRWRSLKPADALKEINRAAYEQERALARVDWEDTWSEIRDALRGGFLDLVSGFADALSRGEDGKYKTFHVSKVEHLKDFLRTFEARDLTDDGELQDLAAKAREILDTVDPANVRKNLTFRDELAGKFSEIREAAKELTEKRGRKLNLDIE